MLGVLFSSGDFPQQHKLAALSKLFADDYDRTSGDITQREWDQTIARSFVEEEEHNPKLVYVLRRMWEKSDQAAIYRVAATQAATFI